jgi:hypothetical protein
MGQSLCSQRRRAGSFQLHTEGRMLVHWAWVGWEGPYLPIAPGKALCFPSTYSVQGHRAEMSPQITFFWLEDGGTGLISVGIQKEQTP